MIINTLKKKTLSYKILMAFIFIAIILILQSLFSLFSLNLANKSLITVHNSNVKVESFAREITMPLSNIRMLSMELVLAPNKQMVNTINNNIDLKVKKFDDTIFNLNNNGQKSHFNNIALAWHKYKKSLNKTRAFALQSTRIAAFINVTKEEKLLYEEMLVILRSFNHTQLNSSKIIFNEAASNSNYTFLALVISTIICVLILIAIMKRVLKMVSGYIEQKQEYEKEIKDSRKKFEAMVSNVPGAIYRVVDESSWPIVYFSDEIENITGYALKDFIESKIQTFATIIHTEDIEPIEKSIQKQLSKTNKFVVDYRVIAKNGDVKWVRDQGQSVKSGNNEAFIDGVLIDITQQKELEEELELLNINLEQRVKEEVEKNQKQNQQMLQQSRLAQMGEMISMIAHQWRQPLNAISLTSSNLQVKLMMDEIDHKFFKKEIELINQYSQHLSKTIDDFRDFFKEHKDKEITTLDYIVNSTLDIVKVSVKNKNIKVITDLHCHVEFKTYPNEIKQVVLNIIKNAEDVLLEMKIENATITIQTLCDEDKIDKQLIIKDNAGGIPEDIMDKIFDPYFSTKLGKEGTGLGLYMSKTIIEEHCGGKLSVSNDGNGAVFIIDFDAERRDHQERRVGA